MDLRDKDLVDQIFTLEKPDSVIHFAAQAIVSRGYRFPHLTLSTNLMSAVNVLDAALLSRPSSVLVASSDKVYRSKKSQHIEDDPLGGNEPYSSSKASIEHIVAAYQSLVQFPIATVRCGNVIGGGDFGEDRLIPDWIRAKQSGREFHLRNPQHVRPWLYVLDALWGYLLVLEHLITEKPDTGQSWNIGALNNVSVEDLVGYFEKEWQHFESHPNSQLTDIESWEEDPFLSLSTQKAQQVLGWCQHFSLEQCVFWTLDGYRHQNLQTMQKALNAYLMKDTETQ
jgi:CDP-glucose 4,6-dehydratase